jgi:hypothetical protein
MRRARALLRLTAVLLVCSGSLAAIDGCTIINGLVVPADASVVKVDAPTSGETSVPDAGDGCLHAFPPAKRTDIPDIATDLTMVVVARELSLATKVGADPIGYDLDRKCTKQMDPATQTCIPKLDFVDPPNGIDNNGGELFATFRKLVTSFDLEERANQGIMEGRNAFLIGVTGYNGTANDQNVTVALYASPGLDGVGPPAFDETDRWTLDEAQFPEFSPTVPRAVAAGAYVTNGTLVANLNATVGVSASFSLTLTGGVITGVIDLTGAKPTITKGVIAGRWAASDILQVISRQRVSDGGQSLCENAITLAAAKAQICDNLDILSSVQDDPKGTTPPSVNCDAVSVSIGFDGARASLGKHVPVAPDEPCPGFVAGDCK